MRRYIILALAILLVLGVSAGIMVWYLRTQQTPLPSPSLEPSPSPTSSLALPSPVISPSFASVTPCPAQWVGQSDGDGDTLPDALEILYQTDAALADTDGDGFSDGAEVKNGFDPTKSVGNPRLDSDHDGLFEQEECEWKTNLFLADTDGDGFLDGAEVKNGFDPTKKGDGKGNDRLATTPISFPLPSPTSSPAETPLHRTTLPSVSPAELRLQQESSAAAIRAYLSAVDALQPGSITNESSLGTALRRAFEGDAKPLHEIRNELKTYEQRFLQIVVPQPAVTYHLLSLQLTRFVHERLGAIELSAASDRARALAAVEDLERVLPGHLSRLQTMRQILEQSAVK